MIYFKANIEPVGKGRPKVTTKGMYAHAYTPKKTKEYEDAIKDAFLKAYGSVEKPIYPKDVPLKARMVFGFGIPKSYTNKKKRMCLNGEFLHTKKPDNDNCVKAVCDALNGVAFEDDSQITYIVSEKIWAEEPFVFIKIEERA